MEFIIPFFVAAAVGVLLQGELAISLLDRIGIALGIEAEGLVRILHCCALAFRTDDHGKMRNGTE
jgi:hypothetical protein